MNQDCTVECLTCGKRLQVNFSTCLHEGWPKCNGHTMRLITPAKDIDIDGAIRRVIDKGLVARFAPSIINQGERTP